VEAAKPKVRPKIVFVNGKPVLQQPSLAPQAVPSSEGRQIVEVDHQDRKLSSLMYLRPSKRQPSSKWTDFESCKFYDAVKVFGRNCDLIHHVVFSAAAAPLYKHPEDFTPRSLVQIRKKLKKDAQLINVHVMRRLPSEDLAWFESKYNLSLAPLLSPPSESDSEESAESEDLSKQAEFSEN
jgi:hypothetical protein